jgi:hypothetical protein
MTAGTTRYSCPSATKGGCENLATTESPLKVQKATKERVRLGAAILACTQGEFVDRAVAEYLENHKDDLKTRVNSAREALLGGDDAMLAYLRGEQ